MLGRRLIKGGMFVSSHDSGRGKDTFLTTFQSKYPPPFYRSKDKYFANSETVSYELPMLGDGVFYRDLEIISTVRFLSGVTESPT